MIVRIKHRQVVLKSRWLLEVHQQELDQVLVELQAVALEVQVLGLSEQHLRKGRVVDLALEELCLAR